MSAAALVFRPEPDASETAARLAAAGVSVIKQPLFAIEPIPWTAPDPTRFDALLLTSGNAARHAGGGLATLSSLPALAVGAKTAEAARAAGLRVVLTGERDAASLLAAARAQGFVHPLHLAGRDRVGSSGVETITVYASEALPLDAGVARGWEGGVALVHSARAARRFAELVARDGADRGRIAVAALSRQVADAAGTGWTAVAVAERPADTALVARAVALIDRFVAAVDKSNR